MADRDLDVSLRPLLGQLTSTLCYLGTCFPSGFTLQGTCHLWEPRASRVGTLTYGGPSVGQSYEGRHRAVTSRTRVSVRLSS